MEDLLGQLKNIGEAGVVVAPFHPDIPMPLVATADIGLVAARALDEPGPAVSGQPEIIEIQGERDVSMREVTSVIAEATGRHDLCYLHQSNEEFAAQLRAEGLSDSVASLMVEVVYTINSGHTRTLQPCSAEPRRLQASSRSCEPSWCRTSRPAVRNIRLRDKNSSPR